jgi:hypothetical protein
MIDDNHLEEVIRDPSVVHVANVFHYLVIHANIKQYYYELKYVRDDRRLIDLIGRGLKNLDVLKRSEEDKSAIDRLQVPNNEDLAKALEDYRLFKERFIAALGAMTVASCPICWSEKKQTR